MRAIFKTFHSITGLLLVISTFFQAYALLGGVVFNPMNDFTSTIPWLVPVWSAMLLLLIVVFVLDVKIGHKYPWPPILLAISVVATVAAFVVAVTLRDALPDSLNTAGETQGLTTVRLLYRHMSSVAVGALLLLTTALRWVVCSLERRRAKWDATVDASTLGLETYADEPAQSAPRRVKRSLRKKQ